MDLRNRTWESRPSLFIDENAPLFKHERDIILEIQAVHPGEFARDNTMFDRLVRMQHFNLPTRLLDVTANPLVALYFASELSEPETDGSVVVYSVPRLRVKFFSRNCELRR